MKVGLPVQIVSLFLTSILFCETVNLLAVNSNSVMDLSSFSPNLIFLGLYLASYESESPENQTEKERWKNLRYLHF